ncbi:caspase-8 isoform X2 [Condylostylus longicornis]|uniref:caspase-8 isoform X2 n=1 Tax=Condylostylus longicornis TaxID=2530218 RepID=UPI00244E417B|nr:caspase-8 isoform X2 [Condylostylus longicornis]
METMGPSSKSKNNILSQIQNLHSEDLPYLERDLCFAEKVSLAFLLFGNTKANNLFALQKLLALYMNQNLVSDILFNFTRENKKNWRFCLIEALAIIKAHKVLRKLGVSKYEYEITFLPYRPETSLSIHPVLKALYFVCENLSQSETQALLCEVRRQIPGNNFNFSDSSFLEIFLLDWMTSSIIEIGEWPDDNSGSKKPNMKIITNFLKVYGKDTLKDILESACKYVSEKNERKEDARLVNDLRNLSIQSQYCVPTAESSSSYQSGTEIDYAEHDIYKLERGNAGFALIINQYEFYEEKDPNLRNLLPESPFKNREGTMKDRDALKETFEKFGYISQAKNNLTHNEILAIIRDYVKKSIIFDSLIICILSHGLEGVVYGSNSIPVKINDIEEILASSKELYKKPKVLIIQACQVPGYASFRDKGTGSWFIQSLCKKINNFGHRKHFQDIVTGVINEVSGMKSKQNLCMVPQQRSTLTKSLWLPKI